MNALSITGRQLATITQNETVAEAARRMRSLRVGDLIVLPQSGAAERPVGVLSDKDIVAAIVEQGALRLAQLTVREVMSPVH
jgi:CBS domain-containing protein